MAYVKSFLYLVGFTGLGFFLFSVVPPTSEKPTIQAKQKLDDQKKQAQQLYATLQNGQPKNDDK